MNWKTFLQIYLGFGLITIPITIAIANLIIKDLIELIFNSGKINQLLKHSDSINVFQLQNQYEVEKTNQSKLTKSLLMELERQINYKRLMGIENKPNSTNRIFLESEEKAIAAKRVSDIFKIN